MLRKHNEVSSRFNVAVNQPAFREAEPPVRNCAVASSGFGGSSIGVLIPPGIYRLMRFDPNRDERVARDRSILPTLAFVLSAACRVGSVNSCGHELRQLKGSRSRPAIVPVAARAFRPSPHFAAGPSHPGRAGNLLATFALANWRYVGLLGPEISSSLTPFEELSTTTTSVGSGS